MPNVQTSAKIDPHAWNTRGPSTRLGVTTRRIQCIARHLLCDPTYVLSSTLLLDEDAPVKYLLILATKSNQDIKTDLGKLCEKKRGAKIDQKIEGTN